LSNEQPIELTPEDTQLIYENSILIKKFRSKAKVVDKVIQEKAMDKTQISLVLTHLGYDRIYEHRKSLKSIFKLMDIQKKEFFNLFAHDHVKLKKQINDLKERHPLIIKYLDHIFKDSVYWQKHLDESNEFETAYRESHFNKGDKQKIKSIIKIILFHL
jgi:hypothetical protein